MNADARQAPAWRMCGAGSRPPDSPPTCPNHDGDGWRLRDRQNRRRRTYEPAAEAAMVNGDLRVYRLRGSFVSLLLWEGHRLTYVADQAGHSVATLANHYAGVLKELEEEPRIRASDRRGSPRGNEVGAERAPRRDEGEG